MKRSVNMKWWPMTLLVAFLAGVSGSGCNKEKDDLAGYEDEAADVVAGSLAGEKSTQGVAGQAEDVVEMTREAQSAFGKFADFDTTVYRKGSLTGGYIWDYTFHFSWAYGSVNSVIFTYDMKGSYDTPRLGSSDSSDASWTVTGLLPRDSSLVINGTYERKGSQVSKVRNKRSLTTNTVISLKDMTIGKVSKRITGGTADCSISGSVSDGKTFSFTGKVVFHGNQTATLTINDSVYELNLITGNAQLQ